MTRYQIVGLHKFAEEDSFEHGCLPGTGTDFYIDVSFTGKTREECIKRAADFLGIGEDGIERDSCDEIGRIDFARTENDDGSELSDRELEEWKAGKRKAWYVVYTGMLQRVTAISAA
jgi:hypothetical protein